MPVAHRHLHRLMAEQLGDGPQRGPAHHQPGRERVPKVVPREVLDLGELQGGVEAVLDVLYGLADLRPRRVREYVRRFGLRLPKRPLRDPSYRAGPAFTRGRSPVHRTFGGTAAGSYRASNPAVPDRRYSTVSATAGRKGISRRAAEYPALTAQFPRSTSPSGRRLRRAGRTGAFRYGAWHLLTIDSDPFATMVTGTN